MATTTSTSCFVCLFVNVCAIGALAVCLELSIMSKFARHLSRFVEDGKVSILHMYYKYVRDACFSVSQPLQAAAVRLRLLTRELCHVDKYIFFVS